jgi:hypothetical protein
VDVEEQQIGAQFFVGFYGLISIVCLTDNLHFGEGLEEKAELLSSQTLIVDD